MDEEVIGLAYWCWDLGFGVVENEKGDWEVNIWIVMGYYGILGHLLV